MSETNQDPAATPSWIGRRTQRALEAIVEDALKKAILGGAGLVVAAAIAGGVVLWRRTPLPVGWRIVVMLAGIVFLVGIGIVVVGTIRLANRTRRLQLADVGELEDELAQAGYAQEFLRDIIDTLQAMMAAEEVFGYERFAEDAVLEPARVFLQRGPAEEVRLSLLMPRDEHRFEMKWAVGHRPHSQAAFNLPIDGSVAGSVFRTGETVVIGNVQEDPAFMKHPKATRPYETLVCAPVRLGDAVAGVLNVVSTYRDAVTKADVLFIEVVASVVSFVLALEVDAFRVHDEDEGAGRRPS